MQLKKLPKINEFIAALQEGRDKITYACTLLVEMVDEDSRIYQEIMAQNPGISYQLLSNLERVGRGAMAAEMLYDTSDITKRLIQMPARIQKQLYKEGIDIVTREGDKFISKHKRIQHLTRMEIRQVFDDDNKPRNHAEQIKWLSSQNVSSHSRYKNPGVRYVIEGDVVTFMSHTSLTMVQVEELLNRMKESAMKELEKKK